MIATRLEESTDDRSAARMNLARLLATRAFVRRLDRQVLRLAQSEADPEFDQLRAMLSVLISRLNLDVGELDSAETRAKPIQHECRVCGLTSGMAPKTAFRYCSQCAGQQCYCPDHLRDHEHVTEEQLAS